ncbi:hypothetical protein HOF40_03965, partial [Candidatus Parcubacteria bacterium]|nr:hypothetical protein [Candidatus Parcubacteria bacterium]
MSFSIKDKVYNVAREYVYLGIMVLFLAVAGVFLPNLYDGSVGEVQAYSLSTPVTVKEDAGAGKHNTVSLQYVDGVYYSAYTTYDGSGPPYFIEMSTSTDGTTWGVTTTIISKSQSQIDYKYHYNDIYHILVSADSGSMDTTDSVLISTSTYGANWSATSTAVVGVDDDGMGIKLATAPDSSLVAIAYVNYTEAGSCVDEGCTYIEIATSTDLTNWTTSSLDGVEQGISVLGLEIDFDDVIHIIYDERSDENFNTSTDMSLHYVNSSNWVSTTIDSSFDYESYIFEFGAHMALDSDGNPGIIYYSIDEIDTGNTCVAEEDDGAIVWGGDCMVTTSLYYKKYDVLGWGVTTTIDTFAWTMSSSTDMSVQPRLSYFGGTDPVVVYVGDDFYPYFSVNTSTWSSIEIDNKPMYPLSGGIGFSLGYNDDEGSMGLLYTAIDGADADAFFVTSSVLTEVVPYDGSLPTLDTDAKTKLLWVDNVYYLAFSSSSADGIYDVYLTTSTDGSDESWSEPQEVFTGLWAPDDYGKGLFAFEYNSNDSYFGIASYTTGTSRIDFATSSDAFSWSATSTVADHLPTTQSNVRRIYLDFGTSDSYVALFYSNYDQGGMTSGSYEVATSTNGGSWSTSTIGTLNNGEQDFFAGGVISGSGASRVFHAAFFEDNLNDIIYSSSTDGGATWTSTTVAEELNTEGPAEFTINLAVDDNGLPGLVYHGMVTSSMPNVTSTLIYNKKGDNGVWASSTIDTPLTFVVDSNPEPSAFTFFNTDDPIVAYGGSSFYPHWAVNTSTDFVTTSISGSNAVGISTEMGLAYDSTDEEVAIAYVSGGQLYFSTSSLPTPTVAWDGSLSSITEAESYSWTKLIYANSQYNYFFAGLEDGNYYVELTTSTSGADGTWSEVVQAFDTPIKVLSEDGNLYTMFDIQYNASTSYFGLTAYVSSTNVMFFATSTDGMTWGTENEIYNSGGSGDEWVTSIDFLEGTDYIAITFEYDSVALSSDAGVNWTSSTIDVVDPDNDDLFAVGIATGSVLHAVYRASSTQDFVYTSSTDDGVSWTTSSIFSPNGTGATYNKFMLDGNGRPSALLYDQSFFGDTSASGTMYFASLESGVWSTSTIGVTEHTFSDGSEVASPDMGFYGAKPYMVYYGDDNY